MEIYKRYNNEKLIDFARSLNVVQEIIPIKVSSRGWSYILENQRLINKDNFDRIQVLINDCRKKGYLPVDFVKEEDARSFNGVETPDDLSPVEFFGQCLNDSLESATFYDVDWWNGETYYIQMVVEKIDLVTLFKPICQEYHIPIANAKGWSSILQRAEFARRFKEAEDKGLTSVLLYAGDFDPDGLRISKMLRKNLNDLYDIRWSDGYQGYDADGLIIDRFGLNLSFIQEYDLTWIDNLITGSGKSLADPGHKSHKQQYVQSYLHEIGERKCEANVLVTMPETARDLVRTSIEKYLGFNAHLRFLQRRQEVINQTNKFMDDNSIRSQINKIIRLSKE